MVEYIREQKSFMTQPFLNIIIFFVFFSYSDLPDPIANCTAYNATAYTMQFACMPGNDGGIKQSFFVEVIDDYANEVLRQILMYNIYKKKFLLKVFDGKEKIFNVSSDLPMFQLVRLPSDSRLIVRVMKHFMRSFSIMG